MDDPTVLDLLISLFSKSQKIKINNYLKKPNEDSLQTTKFALILRKNHFAMLCLGLGLALIGQYLLEPPRSKTVFSLAVYVLALILFWISNPVEKGSKEKSRAINKLPLPVINSNILLISMIFLTASVLAFGGNHFYFLNTTFWVLGITLFIYGIWQKNESKAGFEGEKTSNYFPLLIVVVLVSVFFRFYLLNKVPGEMFSDHAEKLLDIQDVLDGQTPIIFPRNTGREAIQFYLTAGIIRVFRTGITYLSLKIGTAFLGFITLPFLFLIGKYLKNIRVGIFAMLFAGFAYWPNVISRVGLRFPLYPLFSAITIYFLFRAFEEKNFNHFILAGLALGVGLHGYSPIRIIPLAVVVITLIYVLNKKKKNETRFALIGIALYGISALVIFIPLLRYMVDYPQIFNYRALSRLTSVEAAIDRPIIQIFAENTWKSFMMFFFDNGNVWVNSIPNRPALDVVSAVFFAYGFVLYLKTSVKNGSWQNISILVLIPLLMLPSILSFAFPKENPALNRSGAAIIPVFIIIGTGIDDFGRRMVEISKNRLRIISGYVFFVGLICVSLAQNFNLVFNIYNKQYLQNAWNSSEIGEAISQFVDEGNRVENAYVIPYPYWVDTRLVGINAGYPRRDFALWPKDLEATKYLVGNKLFIIFTNDVSSLQQIKTIYPLSEKEVFHSKTIGKDFLLVTAR